MKLELIDLYKKYEGYFCDVAVEDWNNENKLFWYSGIVKRVDNTENLYLEIPDEIQAISLTKIKKIKIKKTGDY